MIPEGWRIERLENIASVERGKFSARPRNDPRFYGGDIPFVQTGDVTASGGKLINYSQTLNKKGLEVSRLFPKGTILITIAANIGDVALATFDVACPDSLVAVRANYDVSNEWLAYSLQTKKQELDRAATQNAQKNINLQVLRPLKMLVPPPLEQHKIAAILTAWDRAIALTERCIEVARQRKKGLLQLLLIGRVRFLEFVRSEDRQETKFGNLPIDWKVVPLQKLVKPISRSEAIQPGEDYKLIGVKWYVAGAHIHSVLLGQDIKTASLSRIEENDIVYNKMWTAKAAFAVAKPEHSGAYGTTEYPQFRAKENMLFVGFLEYIFHLARFQYEATALCRGTTGRARLNPRDFLRLEIPLPSLEEQHRIAAVLQACNREIELLTQKRDALQQQKKGLMQRLLTGRVRVNA